MKIDKQVELIHAREDWLIKRILKYAKQQDYAQYTSTLEEAWRISIVEMSRVITENLPKPLADLELKPDQDFKSDPAAAFGILEADRHRQRGTPLTMFVGFYKYYLQTYLDLIETLDLVPEDSKELSLKVTRIFDRIELGYLHKWTSMGEGETIQELQSENQNLSNEKNMFLTMIESVRTPVLYLNESGQIIYMNSAGARCAGLVDVPVGGYYERQPEGVDTPEWLQKAIQGLRDSGETGASFEHVSDKLEAPLHLQVSITKMLDVSEKFLGYSVFAQDITSLWNSENQLKGVKTELEHLNFELTAERDRVQSYLDLVEAIIVALDNHGNITMLNRKGCEVLQVEESEIIGRNWFETCLPPGSETEELTTMFKNMISADDNLIEYFENQIAPMQGEPRIIAWHNNYQRNEAGEVVGTISAGEDITERQRNLDQLHDLLNDRKKFFSIIGHDLRGPMGAIVGMLDVLNEDFETIEPEQTHELIASILESAENTQRLIHTLLDWARVTEGRMVVDRTQIPAQTLIRDSMMDCREMYEGKDIRVEADVPLQLIVAGDYSMLNTVLRNLLGNAIKFSHPGSSISIKAEQQDREVRFSVQDSGEGMDEKTIRTLFKPAHVIRHDGTAGERGTGLGLSLSREFVHLHRGEITVSSEVGKGSCFTVILPT